MSKLVTVATFSNVNDAHVAKLRLDMAEVDSVIIDSEAITMDWFLGRALGLIKLQVRDADAVRAQEVLASKYEPASDEDNDSA